MKKIIALICFLSSTAVADDTKCSPDPAVSPDGFGQAVGEAGETNQGCEEE